MSIDIKVEELKTLNKFLISQINQDEEAQFLDQDESVFDLSNLKNLLRFSKQGQN